MRAFWDTTFTQAGLTPRVANYELPIPGLFLGVEITCTDTEENLWAIRFMGRRLNKDGQWEHESMPSSRSDAFLARTRWPREEALKLAVQLPRTYPAVLEGIRESPQPESPDMESPQQPWDPC